MGDVDAWLEQVRQCQYLKETDIKRNSFNWLIQGLCEMVKELLMEESNVQLVRYARVN